VFPTDRHAPAENRTLFQSFEWYLPGPSEEGSQSGRAPSHYALLTALLPHLAALGISDVWLPPGCKAISDHDTGYGIYDLWDLGEFDAKGHIRTKWGDRAELQTLCDTAKELGVGMLWDAVLNHKAGADAQETSRGIKVDPKGRYDK
jgi:alpha-amylase